MTFLNTSSKFIRFLTINSAVIMAFCLATAIAASAQTLTTLVIFEGTNGNSPNYFPPVQWIDGNLYGITQLGGSISACSPGGGCGTIFSLTPAGSLTTIYNFCPEYPQCPRGMFPNSLNFVYPPAGNYAGYFNGITGGTGGKYSVDYWMYTPGYPETNFNFCNSGWSCDTDGFNPTSGITVGMDGQLYGTTMGGGTNDAGTIFRIHTKSLGKSKLHSFCSQPNCADGKFPMAGVFQATDGNLYGTTEAGGAYSRGTVYKVASARKLTTLYNFCAQPNCGDGAYPQGGLVQGKDGNFYGTTGSGGAYDEGTVFRLTSNGTLTTLHSFNGADGSHPLVDLIQATDGNFYGTTDTGGAYGYGTIFQITPSAVLTTLHSFDNNDGSSPSGLMQHTNGTIYGTTSSGGDLSCDGFPGCGTVFSLSMGLQPYVSVLPTWGAAGWTVFILGQGFTTTSNVAFGSTSASFTVASDTYIKADVPPDAVTGYVTVTTSAATLTSNTKFFVWPAISSFSPGSGPVGTPVTIRGGGFLNGTTKVTIGGRKANFTVDSGSQITAIVPKGAVTGKIKVTTAGGTATSSGVFTVT